MSKIFRNYNTLSQFNSESVHPENKICFIKDKGVLYLNGVQYSPSKMDTIDNISDSNNIVDKFNELRNNLLKSNLMTARTPHNIVYWTGDSNTIKISGNNYTTESDCIIIDGVGCYKLKLYKDLDNSFCKFNQNQYITNLIFKDVNTSNVTDMGFMFYSCSSLVSLDVSGWDTNNVTNMGVMFYSCSALTSLDLSGWNTSNVTDMGNMFKECKALTSLDLSGWDTSNVTKMNKMFTSCNALKTIRMVGCSQDTIDKIKAQLSTDGITGCTIVTE